MEELYPAKHGLATSAANGGTFPAIIQPIRRHDLGQPAGLMLSQTLLTVSTGQAYVLPVAGAACRSAYRLSDVVRPPPAFSSA